MTFLHRVRSTGELLDLERLKLRLRIGAAAEAIIQRGRGESPTSSVMVPKADIDKLEEAIRRG